MEKPTVIEKRADSLTRWIGSPQSIIVHTLLFSLAFILAIVGLVSFDRMLLVLTTMVSLEAIYLAIFIQMTVNRQSEALAEVEQDIDEIQEDVGEIQDDIDEIQEDVEEIGEDMEELQEDVEEISDDIDELEDLDEEKREERRKQDQKETLDNIQTMIAKLSSDLEKLKK